MVYVNELGNHQIGDKSLIINQYWFLMKTSSNDKLKGSSLKMKCCHRMTSWQSTIDQWICFLHCRPLMRGTDGFPLQKGKCRWYGTLMFPLLLDWTQFGLPAILGTQTIMTSLSWVLCELSSPIFENVCYLSLVIFTLNMLICLQKTKYIYFYHCWTLRWHRHLKSFLAEYKNPFILHTMAVNDLATQSARAKAAMLLTQFSRNIPALEPMC